MSKISNVLLFLQYLGNGRKYSVKELSELLEVSERMVRIYKEEVEKAGIYIDTIQGPYGGYVLNQSFSVPSCRFSMDDYQFLKSLKIDSKNQEKLNYLTHKIKNAYYESMSDSIELNGELKDYYNLLTKAIREHRKVKILYYSYTHGNQERVIHPFGMFFYQTGWGCAAYCELKQDLRHFELKRIKKISLLCDIF